jgi:hypothetical protein
VPTSKPTFVIGSHNQVIRCSRNSTKRNRRRLFLAMHEINCRSFAAAIFQAGMCRYEQADHPDVMYLFQTLAENTRKVGKLMSIYIMIPRALGPVPEMLCVMRASDSSSFSTSGCSSHNHWHNELEESDRGKRSPLFSPRPTFWRQQHQGTVAAIEQLVHRNFRW